jgi:hypothetical protein
MYEHFRKKKMYTHEIFLDSTISVSIDHANTILIKKHCSKIVILPKQQVLWISSCVLSLYTL